MNADASASPEQLIGEVLANRYQIEARLGEGGMGTVYKARHVKVGRSFAVKVLHARLTIDNKVLQRFEREAELAGRLRHPNVIGVIDVGETPDGLRYMVMDFAEGPDLGTLLAEGPIAPERIIHLTRQLLEGLYHAHEAGLIHRDFKPENVIVERDTHGADVPRIVDFGISILREGGDSAEGPGRLTTNGLVLGTPHYMAPEQAVADPIDHRIDLFALGIMIYEMLCGKLPFDGTGAEVARANLLLEPPPIFERVPHLEVDPLLEAFARKLMAKSRDLRPSTAKSARELLDLIDEDRDAAALALGVPVTQRAPKETAESQPVRKVRDDYEGTFPPPIRAMAAVQTQVTEPMRPGLVGRRHAPIIAATVAGLGVLGIAGVVILGGGHRSGQAPQLAATSPAANVAPIETRATSPVTRPADPEVQHPVDTKPADTHAPSVVDGSAATKPATTKSVTTKPATTKPVHAQGTMPAHTVETRPAETRPVETRPVESRPVESRPVETRPAETRPVESGPIDSAMLAGRYQTVGRELKGLEQAKGADTTTDLWGRYRLIRITDAMSTQAKRDATAAILEQLRAEIRSRSR